MTNNTPSRNTNSQNRPDPDASSSTEPIEYLRPGYQQLSSSLLNRDGVGIIEERLPGGAMAGLNLWFIDSCEGADGGFALLARAPIMFAFLDVYVEEIDPHNTPQREQCWLMFALGLWLGSELQADAPGEAPMSLAQGLDRICDLHNGQLPGSKAVLSVVEETHQIATRLMQLRPSLNRIVRAGFHQVGAHRSARGARRVPARFLFFLGLVASGMTHPFSDESYLKGLKLRFDRGLDGKVKGKE